MPLVVFLLLVVFLVMLIGVACACLTDHPMNAAERSLAGPAAMPALVEVWALIVLVLLSTPLLLDRRILATGRASPAVLQRFLF
jgi:hypothetical protein